MVQTRTTLLITRFRFHLKPAGASSTSETILCEEIVPLAFIGQAASPQWLNTAESEHLLAANPEKDLVASGVHQQINLLINSLGPIQTALEAVAKERATLQLKAHERVRQATKSKGRVTIEPVLPVDILGAFVLLPRLA